MCNPLGLKLHMEQLAVFLSYPSSEMSCQTIMRRVKRQNRNLLFSFFPLLCSLSGVWLPYDNPDWSSCSSQLFLFNYITDWDINLRFATTVPRVGEGFVIVKHRLTVTPVASVVVSDMLLSLEHGGDLWRR